MNMECQLYPSDGHAVEQTDRLTASIRDLAKLRPQTRG
jgi:hypothetical protein